MAPLINGKQKSGGAETGVSWCWWGGVTHRAGLCLSPQTCSLCRRGWSGLEGTLSAKRRWQLCDPVCALELETEAPQLGDPRSHRMLKDGGSSVGAVSDMGGLSILEAPEL